MDSHSQSKHEKQQAQKRADRISKLTLPKGAFVSQRPRTQAIDLELRDLQRRDEEFNESIRKELLKLNFPLIEKKPEKSGQLIKKNQNFKLSMLSSLKTKPKSPKFSKTPVNEHRDSVCTRKKTRNLTLVDFNFTRNEKEPLPALVKSIPIHMDPGLKYEKMKTKKFENGKNKLFRLNSINAIISDLQEVDRGNYDGLEKSIDKIARKTREVYQCVNSLCESTKFGLNTSLETIVQLQNDANRLTRFILDESNKMTFAVYN